MGFVPCTPRNSPRLAITGCTDRSKNITRFATWFYSVMHRTRFFNFSIRLLWSWHVLWWPIVCPRNAALASSKIFWGQRQGCLDIRRFMITCELQWGQRVLFTSLLFRCRMWTERNCKCKGVMAVRIIEGRVENTSSLYRDNAVQCCLDVRTEFSTRSRTNIVFCTYLLIMSRLKRIKQIQIFISGTKEMEPK